MGGKYGDLLIIDVFNSLMIQYFPAPGGKFWSFLEENQGAGRDELINGKDTQGRVPLRTGKQTHREPRNGPSVPTKIQSLPGICWNGLETETLVSFRLFFKTEHQKSGEYNSMEQDFLEIFSRL